MGLIEFLKRQDLFGVPVQLTYRGESAFSSPVGGCCSIMLVLITMALFGVYSHDFYHNPEYSTSATVKYIDFMDWSEHYELPTNRTTMAVYIYSARYLYASKYLRARFYSSNGTLTPIKAVFCEDFYADKIAAE